MEKWNYCLSKYSCVFSLASSDTSRDPFDGKMKMSLGNEVKREVEGKLSEANENEKYLYSRVMELEKRNQLLEKKVKKLK